LLVALCCVGGFVLRAWNLDFDQRQHLHPDERHWSMTSDALARAPRPAEHGTIAGPILDWLDGQRSPANPYRVTDSFVYGPVTLAAGRGVAGWLHDGAVDGDQPAAFVVDALDRLGIPLLDDDGAPRFDDGYGVDLVGRLLGVVADTATIAVVALIGRRLGGRRAGIFSAYFAATSVLAIQHAHFFGSEPVLGLASALTVLAMLRLDRGPGVRAACRTGLVTGLAAGATLAAKLTGAGLVLVPFALCAGLAVRHRRRADVVRLVAVAVGTAIAFRVLYPPAFRGLGLWPNPQFLDDLRAQRAASAADLPPSAQWADRFPLYDGTRWLVEFTVGPGASIAAALGIVLLLRHRRRLGRWPVAVMAASVLVPFAFVVRNVVTSGRYFVPMVPALAACAGYAVAVGMRRRQTVVSAALLALAGLWALAFVAGVYGHENTRIAAARWVVDHVDPGSVLSVESWDDGLPLGLAGVPTDAYEFEQFDLWGVDSVDKTLTLARQLARVDFVVESSPRVWNTVTRNPGRYPSTIRFFEALDDGSLGFHRVATFTSPPRLGPFRLDTSSAEEAFSVYDHPEVRIWQKIEPATASELFARLDPLAASRAMPITFDHAATGAALLTPSERRDDEAVGTFAATFDVDGNGLVHAVGWLVVIELIGWSTFALLFPALRRLPDGGAGLSKALGLVLVTFVVFVAVTRLGIPLGRGVVLATVGAWVLLGALAAWRRRHALRGWVAAHRRLLIQAEVLSLTAFVALVLLRAADPDLWHSSRSGEKPFELEMFTAVLRSRTLPPYDGWFAGGSLNYYYAGYLLLSIPARVLRTAPSLAMNLALGAIGAMAVGAVYSAGAACVRADDGARGVRRAGRAGMLAVAFVVLLPNAAIVPRALRRLVGTERGALDWWSLSRVIPDSMAVTEFPAWSLLFADVHPHLVDLGVMAALLAVVIGWYGCLRAGRVGASIGLAAVVGVLVGAVRAINTWDFPLAGLLLVAPLAAVVVRDRRRWRLAVAAAVTAAFVVVVGWGPYGARSEVTDSSVELNSRHTPLASWAWQFGFFAVVTLLLLAASVPRSWWTRRRIAAGVAVAAVVAAGLFAVPDGAAFVASVALAAVGLLIAWRSRHRAAGLLAAAGWSIVAVVELVSVINDTDRMNTVFKGWFQAWLLLGIASAAGLAASTGVARPHWVRRAAIGAVAVAGAMAVAFAQLAVPARLDDRTSPGGLSLDGLAFFADPDGRTALVDPDDPDAEHGFSPAEDLPLIRWMQDHVEGIVTIAEAPGYDYTWRSRISTFTGLPTVIGWPYHERQQRRSYGVVVDDRREAMNDLYAGASLPRIHRVLQRFDIRYVVFGTIERVVAGDRGRETLLASPCLTVEFEVDDLFVASVDQACVAEQPGALPA